MAKLQYVAHGKEAVGYIGPIVDLHDRWLVPPRLVSPDAPDVERVLKPGDFIDLDERLPGDRHFLEWAGSHRDFVVVNANRYGG
jgi:hypothetical protein